MKKFRLTLPVIFMVIVAVAFLTDCKRDYSCKMKIVCMKYNSIDTLGCLPYAHVVVGRDYYGSQPSAEYAKRDTVADANGVCVITFAYPALLDVAVSGYDTVHRADGTVDSVYFTGAAQVQLKESEMTEKTILMLETQQ